MTVGFYYNMEACVGCKLCVVACKDRHGLDVQASYRELDSFNVGRYPDARIFHVSMSCNHCESPACAAACPTGATWQADDGSVQHDDELCIGCQACVNSCPFGAPDYREDEQLAGKCDSCKPLRDRGEVPMCVAACPLRAIDFGEWDDLSAAHPDAQRWGGETGPHYLFSPKPYFDGEGAEAFSY